MKAGQLVVYGRGALFRQNPFGIDEEIKRWRKGRRGKQDYSYTMPVVSSAQKKRRHTGSFEQGLFDDSFSETSAKQVLVKAIWHHKYQKPDSQGKTSESQKVFGYLSKEDSKEQTEFDYYSKEQKAFCLVGEHGQRLSKEEFRQLGASWDLKNKGEEGRTAAHLIFSLNELPNSKNCLIIEQAIRKIQNAYADEGFDTAFAVHQDTQNAHAHLIIRARNNQTKVKLRLGKAELFALRYEFAKSVRQAGLSYCATKSNSPEYQDYQQEKSDQNYLKSVAKRDFGAVGEKLIKKSFIEQHDEGQAGQRATAILKDFRKSLKGDAAAHQSFQDSLAAYSRQLEKFETKQALQEACPSLKPEHVKMTVDYAFAMEAKALKQARSEHVPSLEKLQRARAFKESLMLLSQKGLPVHQTVAVFQAITDFGQRQDENKAVAQQIKQPNPYGDSGRIYMQDQLKWFQKSNDPNKRKRIKQTIDFVLQGQMQQEKLDRHAFELLKEQHTKDKFLAERKAFYQKRLAQNAGVSLEQVNQLDVIFDQYFLNKKQNRFQAAQQFFHTLKNYQSALNDPTKLKKFNYAINQQKTVQDSKEI